MSTHMLTRLTPRTNPDFLGECTIATPTLLGPTEDPSTALTMTMELGAGEKELDGTLSEKKLKLVQGQLTVIVSR